MSVPFVNSKRLPLIGLLLVQLLMGIMLAPRSNFFGIYLNEVVSFPISQVAQVIAFGQVVGIFGAMLGGSLSDQWGHKRVLVLGIMAGTISSLLYLVHVSWQVILLWGIGSFGMGLATVSGQGYLTIVSGAGVLGVSSALYNWGYTIGGAAGTPLSTLVLGENNFRMLGIVLIGFGVLPALVAGFLPLLHAQISTPSRGQAAAAANGYGVFLRRRIMLLALLRFLPTCYYGITTLFPLLIKQQSGSNAAVAWYVTVSSIFASLTQIVAGRFADRYSVRLPTQIAFGGILVAIVGTIFTGQSTWGLYIFGTLGIGAAWALSTLLPGMVTTAAEPAIRGRVFGGLHMVWTIAMMLGTLVGGTLLEIDMRLPFMLVGVLNIVALTLTVPFFQAPATEPAVVA